MGRSFGDRADGSNKIRQLKKELEKLKKENASLRKALDKALQFLQNKKLGEEPEEIEKKGKKKKNKQDGQSCEVCGKGKYKYWSMERADGKKLTTLTCDNEACSHQKRSIT
jgi:hypothetical protein